MKSNKNKQPKTRKTNLFKIILPNTMKSNPNKQLKTCKTNRKKEQDLSCFNKIYYNKYTY